MNFLNKIKSDKAVWIVVLMISLFSLLVVYSSSNVLAWRWKNGNTELFLFKQAFIICFGFLLMFGIQYFNYKYLSRISQISFFAVIPLLLFTLLFGKSEGDAPRWLEVFGISIQSSEIAKITLIVYIARVLSLKQNEWVDFKTVFKHLLLPIGTVCILILPANFSTAAMLACICFVLLFLGRVPIKMLAMIAGIALVCAMLFGTWVWNWPGTIPGGRGFTWKARIEKFMHLQNPNNDQVDRGKVKEENFQADMAKIAVANGQIIGVGPGNSSQRNFLPQANSDFIFAIFLEEYGLIFGLVLIFLYMILFFRGIAILKKSNHVFGGLIAIGLSFGIIFQAFINMAVAVGLFPVTGQPLPLVSSGGTSILFTLTALGIILSVSKWSEVEKQSQTDAA
ncbi:MAG: FtsW/RodA/SpoVE family cell cycle protein [Bacteroidota bacterium]|jgi:cell division protein FtsW